MCELTIAGGYRWVPFGSMKSLTLGPVTALTDVVWLSAVMGLPDSTVLHGDPPVHYPGSESGPTGTRRPREATRKASADRRRPLRASPGKGGGCHIQN